MNQATAELAMKLVEELRFILKTTATDFDDKKEMVRALDRLGYELKKWGF